MSTTSTKEKEPDPLAPAGDVERFEAEQAQGFRGAAPVDPTPNSAYTVAGVGGKSPDPTPENDPEARKAARDAIASPGLVTA